MATLTKEEKQTLKYYNANGKFWADQHHTLTFWQEQFETFQKYIPNGKILEIGSGGGRDAALLIKSGYDYIGTDISVGLLKAARTNYPDTSFLHQSIYDLEFPTGTQFDGFWASAVLLHIPKSKINTALTSLKKYLKPKAVGFISLKLGTGENLEQVEDKEISDNRRHHRLFVYYTKNEFEKVLSENNFKILDFSIKKGSTIDWICFIVQKV